MLAATVLLSFLLTALVELGGSRPAPRRPSTGPGPGSCCAGSAAGCSSPPRGARWGCCWGRALRSTALPIGLGLVWVLAIENLVVNVAAPLLGAFDLV
ncbi:hypothetical protein [Modestobacter italicus]|uniref:hypothetical protein n=1 Tax=Modestobacter italicus (strain DSM 44449 / CECT 9708 / BC 501) TaxID=2732864 RepID=UPI001872757D|nr:hypothetical protein [Modestobacter marinus]